MNTKQKILDTVQRKFNENSWTNQKEIETIIEEKDFYFQKGKDAYDDFVNYKIPKEKLESALKGMKGLEKLDEVSALFEKISFDKELDKKMEILITYLARSGKNSNKWNEYRPKRTVSLDRAGRVNWPRNLLKLLITEDINSLPNNSIRNSINYINDPVNYINANSPEKRKLISENVLEHKLNNDTFYKDIKKLFSAYVGLVNNPKNVSALFGYMLYDEGVKKLWNSNEVLPESQISIADANTQRKKTMGNEEPLNQILYGPPGTGKTYVTKKMAVEIITGNKVVGEVDRNKINEQYRKLVNYGRIGFITFHQSYSYEDFVEGIKPELGKVSGDGIQYEIKDGIFKKMCDKASKVTNAQQEITLESLQYKGGKVWQIKMGEGGKLINYHLDRNEIAVGGFGWFDGHDLEQKILNNVKDVKGFKNMLFENISEQKKAGKDYTDINTPRAAVTSIAQFCLDIRRGDLVVVHKRPARDKAGSKEENKVLAVVEIIGDYKYKVEEGYCHTRKVKSLWRNEGDEVPIDISDINKSKDNRVIGLSPLAICSAPNVKYEALIKKVNEHIGTTQEKIRSNSNGDHLDPPNRFVLIIDEINRGNISKILGELITLLEDNKRLGNSEELEVTLPYSDKPFGVPNNLYIIGTMNTTDRSIAFLDTALRRRFYFTEMMPIYKNGLFPDVDEIDISAMLKKINDRICHKLGRDHQIGHSYFMSKSKNKSEKLEWLKKVFMNSICPLLDEYFYNKPEKIKEIIGKSNPMYKKEDADLKWDYNEFTAENYKKIYDSKDTTDS